MPKRTDFEKGVILGGLRAGLLKEGIDTEIYSDFSIKILDEDEVVAESPQGVISLNLEEAHLVMSLLGMVAKCAPAYALLGRLAEVTGLGDDYDYERFTIGVDDAGEPAVIENNNTLVD